MLASTSSTVDGVMISIPLLPSTTKSLRTDRWLVLGGVLVLHLLPLLVLSHFGTLQPPMRSAPSKELETVSVSLAPPALNSPVVPKVRTDPQQSTVNASRVTPPPMPESALSAPDGPAPSRETNLSPTPGINNAVSPSNPTGPQLDLQIDSEALRNAAREVDRKSVRRLARESGQPNLIDPERPDPLKLAVAAMSEPPCPPTGLMREARGDPMGAPMADRSGDCADKRRERVRARALLR